MATVRINTTQRMVLYRNFVIQEAYDPIARQNVWEWAHEDYKPGDVSTGTCQTLFECIDAIENLD